MNQDNKGYTANLKNGLEVYIPRWPVSIAYENLTKAGQYIGSDNLLSIAELNTAAVMLALMESSDSSKTAGLIKHFVCTARVDGEKIDPSSYDTKYQDDLHIVAEIFAHVVKATYSDFFKQGLAKETSPSD